MGLVLLADDPVLKRQVAIKVMRPEVAADKNARQRFLREAQATAAIDHHHIVHILQVGQENGVPFMVMPLLKGEPLDARLKRDNKLPIADAILIGKQVAEGLAEAHKNGPANCPSKGHDTMSMLMALATETPAPVQALNPEVPTPLANLVMQLLAKEPEQRPASAKAVAERLGEIAGEKTVMLPGPLARRASEGWASLARRANGLLRVLGSALWSLRPWAFRRPGLAFAIEGVVLLLFLLLILLPFASRNQKPISLATDPKSRDREGAELTNSLGMKFVLVPKGKFLMGGGNGNPGAKEVEIDFQLGQYEVTQWEWMQVMGNNPSHFPSDPAVKPPSQEELAKLTLDQLKKFTAEQEKRKQNYWKVMPVEQVSWDDCQEFLKRLNAKEKSSGWVYRLPTEAEWEYACRARPARIKLDSGLGLRLESLC